MLFKREASSLFEPKFCWGLDAVGKAGRLSILEFGEGLGFRTPNKATEGKRGGGAATGGWGGGRGKGGGGGGSRERESGPGVQGGKT